MKYVTSIVTPNTITVVFDEKTCLFNKDHKDYLKVRNLITEKKYFDVEDLITKAVRLKPMTKQKTMFKMVKGQTTFKGEVLPKAIIELLKRFQEQGIPFDGVVNFWNRLKKNPSESSREDLLLFMQHTGIPIREDGKFVAYKYVDQNFKDCHTHTFDNSPGKVVKMSREACDMNRHNTCSRGFHVAAWGYFASYLGSHLMECLVDPEHVVSVPIDYNNMKMRVCEYKVLREVTEENKNIHYDTTSLKRGSKNRVLIPASFIQKAMKGSKGKYLYLHITDGKITLGREKSDNYYKIDEHWNIRIAATSLAKAGFGKTNNFELRYDEELKQIILEAGE